MHKILTAIIIMLLTAACNTIPGPHNKPVVTYQVPTQPVRWLADVPLEERIRIILVKHGLPTDKGLLIKIAMAESNGGQHLVQFNGGPARGYYQIEPYTFRDILNHLGTSQAADYVRETVAQNTNSVIIGKLTYDLEFQTVVARLHLIRFSKAIPANLWGQARYWKKYWNTRLGAGTVKHFIQSNTN